MAMRRPKAAPGVALLVLLSALGLGRMDRPKGSTPMNIHNEADVPIDAYWVHPTTRKLISQLDSSLRMGMKTAVNTYPTHTFVFVAAGSEVVRATPDMARHSHSGVEEHIYVSQREDGSLTAVMKTSRDLAAEDVERHLAACTALTNRTGVSATQQLEDYAKCTKEKFIAKVDKLVQRIDLQNDISAEQSGYMRNYTCADPKMETSKTTDNVIWVSRDSQRVDVGMLFNSSHATVRYNRNFLSSEECSAIMRKATPKLHRATTADSDGGDKVSFSRRADQASIDYRPNAEEGSDQAIVNRVYDRLFEYANYFTKYNLSQPGQEGITAIRYLPTDEYHPHCDGGCDGSKFQSTGRVATMVMYCDMPPKDAGGGTTFSRVNVFTVGRPRDSVFFTYLGPDGMMDDGLTEHSGCPVLEGSKFIATLWFRQGVDKDKIWYKSDPQGYVKKGYY